MKSSALEKMITNNNNKSYNVWSLDLDGMNLTQITELDSWDSYPFSASDGLYFLSGRGNGGEFLGEDKVRIWKLANEYSSY